ncbi:hypothetical protein EAF04_007314 [Stromatinia cepivora]|nr:hypothetical protein EAF04_007314 [Stromatinia cepivora]
MGSINKNENTRPKQEEVRVLVTGFAPFRAQYPINPSWEIVSRLPSYVPTNTQDEGHHPHAKPPIKDTPRRIRIDSYEAPVHVGYKAVRELMPILLDENAHGFEPDYILHIGMASGRPFYSCERRGHRSGYFMRDVDGELLNDEFNRFKEGDKWIWHDCPEELLTSLPFDKMFRQWKEACPVRIDTRISEDAGNYLCDFTYYTSLAHRYKQHRPKTKQCVEITIELIRAMVECDLKATDTAGDNSDFAEEKEGL